MKLILEHESVGAFPIEQLNAADKPSACPMPEQLESVGLPLFRAGKEWRRKRDLNPHGPYLLSGRFRGFGIDSAA